MMSGHVLGALSGGTEISIERATNGPLGDFMRISVSLSEDDERSGDGAGAHDEDDKPQLIGELDKAALTRALYSAFQVRGGSCWFRRCD